jgi:hypothetical protein
MTTLATWSELKQRDISFKEPKRYCKDLSWCPRSKTKTKSSNNNNNNFTYTNKWSTTMTFEMTSQMTPILHAPPHHTTTRI